MNPVYNILRGDLVNGKYIVDLLVSPDIKIAIADHVFLYGKQLFVTKIREERPDKSGKMKFVKVECKL